VPVLLVLAIVGFLGTRAGRLDLEYARLNPIRDAAVLERVATQSGDEAERLRHMTLGSALAAETLYLPPIVVLRAMSLGYPSAVSDLLFVRAHAYFLSHFFADRSFRWLDDYVDAIVGLDPDNPRVYLWAALAVKLGQDVNDDVVRHSNRYLEDGLARFPRDWRMHMDLGFNKYFEFKGANDAEKAASRLAGRDHFATAAGLPGAVIDPNFVHELFRRENAEGLGLAFALQKYYEASDEQREQLRRRIREISTEIEKDIREEEEVWKRDWSWLPNPVFSLIGARPAPVLSRTVLETVRGRL